MKRKIVFTSLGVLSVLALASCDSNTIITNASGSTIEVSETSDETKVTEILNALVSNTADTSNVKGFTEVIDYDLNVDLEIKSDSSNYVKFNYALDSTSEVLKNDVSKTEEKTPTFLDYFDIYNKTEYSGDYQVSLSTGVMNLQRSNDYSSKMEYFTALGNNEQKNLYINYSGLPLIYQTQYELFNKQTTAKYYVNSESSETILDLFNYTYNYDYNDLKFSLSYLFSNETSESLDVLSCVKKYGVKITSAKNDEIEFSVEYDNTHVKDFFKSYPVDILPEKSTYKSVKEIIKYTLNVNTLLFTEIKLDATDSLKQFLTDSLSPNQLNIKSSNYTIDLKFDYSLDSIKTPSTNNYYYLKIDTKSE